MAEKDTLEASVSADFPKEIRETRKKLWPKLRQARMDEEVVSQSSRARQIIY